MAADRVEEEGIASHKISEIKREVVKVSCKIGTLQLKNSNDGVD